MWSALPAPTPQRAQRGPHPMKITMHSLPELLSAWPVATALLGLTATFLPSSSPGGDGGAGSIGREVAVSAHLSDGQEFALDLFTLLAHGQRLFQANFTPQEGGGRPLVKGTGAPLADPTTPLVFPRNFNRISAPDANSCAGCHNAPFAGGGGDFVTNVFVLGQRFDFTTFDNTDPLPTRGCADETGQITLLQSMANSRSTLGMFGAGFIELLARQMTEELQGQRDALTPGTSVGLSAKGVSFGELLRRPDGTWDTSAVEGLPAGSVATSGSTPPNLVVRPFHQAGAVVSLRQFSNNAYTHHHGMQTVERVGPGDPDGDGFVDELTVADVTAVSLWQASLPVPGRVVPRDPDIEAAVLRGEDLFVAIGCTDCHVPYLELDQEGWVFSEPSPHNPPGNLLPGDPYVQAHGTYRMDLTDPRLPSPRLREKKGVVRVPAFTDLKLHDITSGPNDPNREALDMHATPGSPQFFAGNSRFLTKKLWGIANEPPFFHHGLFTTMREAVEAHDGEAADVRDHYERLAAEDQDALIEFLKTLQVLPPGSRSLVVDEKGVTRDWREFPWPPAELAQRGGR